jgi:hypothetical protein
MITITLIEMKVILRDVVEYTPLLFKINSYIRLRKKNWSRIWDTNFNSLYYVVSLPDLIIVYSKNYIKFFFYKLFFR